MALTFALKLISPLGVLFEGEVEEATARSPLGEFGVLAQHINFITSLVPGILTLRLPGESFKSFIVEGGLVEVKDGTMTVLASGATEPLGLDRTVISRELEAAEERLSQMSFYEAEYQDAQRQLMLAQAKMAAAELKGAKA
ncbi:MAG TPA: ATP synthase F1 subunit epsilon [Candidatus Binataceae bacterium]|jgi:F-type H+-transporting ATPase subunit epsilon